MRQSSAVSTERLIYKLLLTPSMMCWQPCQNVKLRTDAQTLCFVNQSYTCYLIYRHAMPQRQGWSCKRRLQGAYRQNLTRGFMHDILHVSPQLGMTDAPAHVENIYIYVYITLHSGQVYPSHWLHHINIFVLLKEFILGPQTHFFLYIYGGVTWRPNSNATLQLLHFVLHRFQC